MFRIYVKTHNKTGLKYLGVTTQDVNTYKGCGVAWRKHLSEHGNDVSTEVLLETMDELELERMARHYSATFDIVKSPLWANIAVENSLSGKASKHKEKKNSSFYRSTEQKEAISRGVRAANARKKIPLAERLALVSTRS